MIFAWIFAIGGIVALAFVFYRLFHGDRPQQDNSAAPGSARTILDERFARGEIDENEYRQRREILNGR